MFFILVAMHPVFGVRCLRVVFFLVLLTFKTKLRSRPELVEECIPKLVFSIFRVYLPSMGSGDKGICNDFSFIDFLDTQAILTALEPLLVLMIRL